MQFSPRQLAVSTYPFVSTTRACVCARYPHLSLDPYYNEKQSYAPSLVYSSSLLFFFASRLCACFSAPGMFIFNPLALHSKAY